MLSYLAEFENIFGPLRVFRSLTFRTVGAAVTVVAAVLDHTSHVEDHKTF